VFGAVRQGQGRQFERHFKLTPSGIIWKEKEMGEKVHKAIGSSATGFPKFPPSCASTEKVKKVLLFETSDNECGLS
jgi:hypothetical protein